MAYSLLDLNVLIMIDLMQDSYITAVSMLPGPERPRVPVDQGRLAAVVVYFCTVKELLLHRFITHFLNEFPLPVSFLKNWDEHYSTYSQRREKLLPALLARGWEDLIAEISDVQNDFRPMSTFLKKATDARISLLHEGDHFDIDADLAKGCLENFFPLLEFYARLNNMYVHPRRMLNTPKTPAS